MSLWERFMRIFVKRKKVEAADMDARFYDARLAKDNLDESARQAMRAADARLPPYSGGFPI
ncbi:hypothetical protein [Reyranella sp.]|jgi:hypothetical protein|uniref:hypothetical protein n=1 Tax=Reyranella sp. TaxID=1929291 RepID=UPI002F952F70